MKYNTFNLAKACVLLGLAVWLSMAVFNNIMDFGTNRYLLQTMITMHDIKADMILGKGLEWRSLNPDFAKILLTGVIIVEIILAFLLWLMAFNWFSVAKKTASSQQIEKTLSRTNLVLIAFMGLWFFFWIGGLWFGYWLKMPQVQQVHMALIALSIIVLIFINLPQRSHHAI